MASAYAVRSEPGPLHSSTAPLDYRFVRRFPGAMRLLTRLVLRLAPASRIRKAFWARAVQLAFSAFERGDFAAISVFYAPDAVLENGGFTVVGPDLPQTVAGSEGIEGWIEAWHEPFEWIRYEITEILDFGEAIVTSGYQEGKGRASGAVGTLDFSTAIRVRVGGIAWQGLYRDREAAISAIGRDPARVPAQVGSAA